MSNAPTTLWQRDGVVARALCALVVLVAGATYMATASHVILGGDSAELAAVGEGGGVAHAPGYPLYILWLRATTWLPATSPAHRAAIATALLASLSVYALQRACAAWGASRTSSAIASAVYAFSPLAWRLGTEPEVFALNVVMAMAIVTVAGPRTAPPRGQEALRAALLALLAGLGISNHHSIVLLAPLGLFAAILAVRRSRRPWSAALGALGAFAVGLLPYAVLVIDARSASATAPCVWGDPSTLDGLLRHFLRKDYGTGRLAVSTAERTPAAHVLLLGERLLVDSFGVALLGPVGAYVAARRLLARGERVVGELAPAAMLVASFVLAGPVFVALFNLPTTGLPALVVSRFHLLPLSLAMVLAAVGLEQVLALSPRLATAALVAVLPLGLGRAALSSSDVKEGHRATLDAYMRNVMTMLPERAIVLGRSDDIFGGFMYAQCALHDRPDVDYVGPHVLLTTWYPVRVSARLGIEVARGITAPGDDAPTLDGTLLLAQLLATGRPVFVTDWYMDGLDRKFASYPIGPIIRVVAPGAQVPAPPALLVENEALYEQLVLEPEPPRRGSWAGARYAHYARPWRVLADAFARAGDDATAEACRRRAEALSPR